MGASMASVARLEPVDSPGPLGVFRPPEIHIECGAFRGSLATLFVCVRESKVDLLDIPLGPVCEAYFRYIIEEQQVELESVGVALAALTYLLERKAWRLLPKPEVEEPDAEDLLDDVDPYVHEFQPMIEDLLGRAEERSHLFFRSADSAQLPYELPFETGGVSPSDLAVVFERLMERAKPDPPETLNRPRRSLSEMMFVVLKALPGDFMNLEEIVTGEFTRTEVVWWFLSLLELIRLGQARVRLSEGQVQFARGE